MKALRSSRIAPAARQRCDTATTECQSMKRSMVAERCCARSLLRICAAGRLARRRVCRSSYPNKPIRMIVAVPPGGPADTLSRLVSPKLTEALGQMIVIDNRAGANGNIAYEMTARAVPDGYTITAVAAGVAINPSLYREVKYRSGQGFCADHAGHFGAEYSRRASVGPREIGQGTDRLRQGASGPARVRVGGQWHVGASRARAVQAHVQACSSSTCRTKAADRR